MFLAVFNSKRVQTCSIFIVDIRKQETKCRNTERSDVDEEVLPASDETDKIQILHSRDLDPDGYE